MWLGVVLILVILSYLWVSSTFKDIAQLKYSKKILGVTFNSTLPFETVSSWQKLALRLSNDSAVTTCNFELAAVSTADRRATAVTIEKGSQEVIIGEKEVFIRGANDEEILVSCHAFACLIEGLECPENILEIRKIMHGAGELSIVAENNISAAGTRAYAELLGVYGFLQSTRLDLNKDGLIDSFEIGKGNVTIRPYLKERDLCFPQDLRNFYQNITYVNESLECDISPAIYLVESEENRIEVGDGGRIVLYGKGQKLFSEAVIVRDIIAPNYILAVYGMS
ncbi:MAG: hypothetical protein ABH950_02195 [Candidatus Altiarchaeota archaeon]